MGKAFKTGDSITLYFGDKMRELLPKILRKKSVYFVDCKIVEIEGDIMTVLSQMKSADDKPPYRIMAICVRKDDKHVLPEGVLGKLREVDKDKLENYAALHGYDIKEFKAALKPFRKVSKKDA